MASTKTKKATATRTRRPWSPASLFKNLTQYMDANKLSREDSIGTVLDELKDSIVDTAIK